MKAKFSFRDLKKAGLYPADVKPTDYEKQAEIICIRFGLKNIYEYSISTAVHYLYPQGIAMGEFKNKFGEDILNVVIND